MSDDIDGPDETFTVSRADLARLIVAELTAARDQGLVDDMPNHMARYIAGGIITKLRPDEAA